MPAKRYFILDATVTYRSGKWKLQYKNLPIIRLAEMYLTRAECNFRLGTSVGATPFEDIATIRSRAGLKPLRLTLHLIILYWKESWNWHMKDKPFRI